LNKTEFVEKVVTLLDQGSEPLVNQRVANRLADARLAAERAANRRLAASEAGGLRAAAAFFGRVLSPARAGFAAVTVAVLAWGVVQWQNRPPVQPESIDLALLVDEAPLSAYTRPDFDSCLNHSC
jgi:hypothetical protein